MAYGIHRESYTTRYANVQVEQQGDIISVYLDAIPHSRVNLSDPTDLSFGYMQVMGHICRHVFSTPSADSTHQRQESRNECHNRVLRKALHLGGCACALPQAFHAWFGKVKNSVIDIDEELIALVRRYFPTLKKKSISLRALDARDFIKNMRANASGTREDSSCHTCIQTRQWDVIVRDVFSGQDAYGYGKVPVELCSVQSYDILLSTLNPGGLLLINTVAGRGGVAKEDIASLCTVIESSYPGACLIGLCERGQRNAKHPVNMVLALALPCTVQAVPKDNVAVTIDDLVDRYQPWLQTYDLLSYDELKKWSAGVKPVSTTYFDE